MNATTRLAIAGFAATGIGFGPARMGYGLFLPQFRAEFGFSTGTAGLIAGAGFLAFLAALPLAAFFVVRTGPRLPVVLGGLSALAGFLLVATAGSVAALTAGVTVAGMSAAFCWAPFNDAAERITREEDRGTLLSVIATGTALGVALAGGLSLLVAGGLMPWPLAWWIFAVAAILSATAASVGVPGRRGSNSGRGFSPPAFLRRTVMPLYAVALVFGATNAIFISFAGDRIAGAGGLSGLSQHGASAVVFMSYGFFGLLGLMTGRIEARLGLGVLLRVIFAAAALSMVLVALRPTGWAAVVLASGLHGAALMAVSAVISFWSLRLFPGQGTTGFTAALIGLAIGSLIGPVLAGFASEAVGGAAMLLSAAIPAFLICAWPRRLPVTPVTPGIG